MSARQTRTRDPEPHPAETRGDTLITERALQRVAAAATASVPGTAKSGGGFDRITGLSYPRFDFQIDRLSRVISVEAAIAVTWPAPVTRVAAAVRSTLATWIEDVTDYSVRSVNVVVGNVVDGPRRVSAEQVAAAPLHPLLRPVHAPDRLNVEAPRRVAQSAALSTQRSVAIHVAAETDLRPVKTSRSPRTREIHVAPDQPLRTVEVAPERPLRSVSTAPEAPLDHVRVAPELPLSKVRVAPERPLVAITAPTSPSVIPVRTAPERPLTNVHVPRKRQLRKIRVNSTAPTSVTAPIPLEPYHPKLPPAGPLRTIEVRPLAVRSPQVKGGKRAHRRIH
ncbi:hypothetical protein CATYP_01945 [Corynebacterium atypicum]|uniref:Asp23/Gls24 family envelope stress response protein n=1 Tax=Corynebacterium atypicum TaxID=191610 RepID=A0ABM5QLK7_9CORY|nr:Asp23/Gls24 family envelope stress response protein [Corynebacterium atypicum]AIG63642.1 hypothetical protein CATYP_01945 [Corynebacterium atypicum]